MNPRLSGFPPATRAWLERLLAEGRTEAVFAEACPACWRPIFQGEVSPTSKPGCECGTPCLNLSRADQFSVHGLGGLELLSSTRTGAPWADRAD